MEKEYLSITEMAKLRKVTSETLRYYDRIGILTPSYIDPETNYRYYSVRKSEKLGVIRELRELGMSIEEIKEYFTDCNLQKSIRMITKHYYEMQKDIERKLFLCNKIAKKLAFLGELTSLQDINTPCIKKFPERYMLTFGEAAGGEKEHVYAIAKLERLLSDVAPILATDCVGVYADEDILQKSDSFISAVPMLFVNKDSVDSEYIQSIPEGYFLCVAYHGGRLEKYDNCFEKAKDFIKENNLKINGKIFQIYKVDVTMTNNRKETLMEIQIPVVKA